MKRKKILLIHTSNVLLHYRIAIYNYFSKRFIEEGYELIIAASILQADNPIPIEFKLHLIERSSSKLLSVYKTESPDIVISFNSLRDLFVLPVALKHKFKKSKLIYWGHGLNLDYPKRNRFLFRQWHNISDAIILYSSNELKYISNKNLSKTYIANNTLDLSLIQDNYDDCIFEKYGISTTDNVIFVGRIEKNKKINNLIVAIKKLNNPKLGLIIIGDDRLGLVSDDLPENIFYLGSIYGQDLHSLLHKSKIFCIPGHVGLGIVDAFYHSLPIITENVRHAPEIIFLKENINGFIVPKGDIDSISLKIQFLMENPKERIKMGDEAKNIILQEGNIESMFCGFLDACNSLFQ